MERRNKYNARRTEVDGITFASRHEANRYSELMLSQRAGIITDLDLQHKFSIDVNGTHVCNYFADFTYRLVETGEFVVEDAKGHKTAVYKLKKKLVKAVFGIDIVEV